MRSRILLTGLLTAALGACSEPAADPALGREEAAVLDARLELALTAANGAQTAVASDVEMNLPPKPQPERPRTETVRQKVAPVASAPAVEPVEAAVQHDHAVAPEQETSADAVLHPNVDAAESPAPGPSAEPSSQPASPAAGGRGKPRPGEVVDVGRSGPGRGPVVIIRGGGGSGNDPCAIHRPRTGRGVGGLIGDLVGGVVGDPMAGGIITEVIDRGTGGALINERVPRTGPAINTPRNAPTFPRGRGGIRF